MNTHDSCQYSYEEHPVNFGDGPAYHDPYDHSSTHHPGWDSSTIHTNLTSGVLAYDSSGDRNSMGLTQAELVASEYRYSPTSNRPVTGGSHAMSRQQTAPSNRKSASGSALYPASSTDALTYIDEDFNYYSNRRPRAAREASDSGLVNNAADMGRSEPEGEMSVQALEYAEPLPETSTPFARFLNTGKYPLEQRIENKRRGIGRQKYPILVWLLTAAMVCVFIWELVVNSRAQGTPVSLKPVVNPMLGPSGSALINLGARFVPCMKAVATVPVTTELPCLNDTANPPNQVCQLEDVCNFGGFHGEPPDQWFRFVTPIFLHAGFIHIILNMVAQCTVSAQIEQEMGSAGFFVLYFAAGIFGNILGGNFALVGLPSLGASGAIFGTVGVLWVDLFAHWKYHYRPMRKLLYMIVELLCGIALGYVPGVDNFAHLGGFLMGLLTGTTLYPVISTTKRHRTTVWGFRVLAVPLVFVLFVVLIRNFYTSDPYAACSGCRYLSCIPTAANNHCQGTGISTTTGI